MKYSDLVKNTPHTNKASVDNVDQSAKIDLKSIDYAKGMKTETFYFEVNSSSKGTKYSVMIMFKGVDENQGLTDEEVAMGFKPKPDLSKNDISVRCACPSYRFRFDHANRSSKASVGAKFPKYIKKTNRPPLNPDDTPGLCKHIMEAMDYLIYNGFVHE